jgi:outer membrane protein
MKWFKIIALSMVLTSLFVGNAISSEIIATADVANSPNVIGLGIALIPDYVGSSNYKVAPLPFFKYTFSGSQRYIKLAGPELTINLLNSPYFQLGPLARYFGSRDDNVDDDVVKNMTKVDSGIALGAFAAVEFKEAEPRNKLNFTIKFLHDVSNAYDGNLFDFDATLWRKLADKWDGLIGVGTTYASDNYMETYFSVNSNTRGTTTPSQLPDFAASGGMRDVRVYAGAIRYFESNWLVGGMFRYQALLGDAKDSPVVDLRGNSNQLAAALFAGYRW